MALGRRKVEQQDEVLAMTEHFAKAPGQVVYFTGLIVRVSHDAERTVRRLLRHSPETPAKEKTYFAAIPTLPELALRLV